MACRTNVGVHNAGLRQLVRFETARHQKGLTRLVSSQEGEWNDLDIKALSELMPDPESDIYDHSTLPHVPASTVTQTPATWIRNPRLMLSKSLR